MLTQRQCCPWRPELAADSLAMVTQPVGQPVSPLVLLPVHGLPEWKAQV